MPYARFFARERRLIDNMLLTPEARVHLLLMDPEMRALLVRLLGGIEQDAAFPHLLLPHGEGFTAPAPYFGALHASLAESAFEHGLGGDPMAGEGMQSPYRFLELAESLAEQLPDHVGSLALLLDPEEVLDPEGWRESIRFLARTIRSPWLKVLVLEPRANSMLIDLAREGSSITRRVVHLPPGALAEARAPSPTARGGSSAAELSLAAARASAAAEHAEAERLSLAAIAALPPDAQPAIRAQALHGLGQTLLRAGRSGDALEPCAAAAEMAADHGLNVFAPTAYATLAAALAAQRRQEEAIAILGVANRYHAEASNIPGEAATCETLGEFHAAAGRKAEAASAWHYALTLYDRITNPAMTDVRESGRASVLEKMHRHRIRHAA